MRRTALSLAAMLSIGLVACGTEDADDNSQGTIAAPKSSSNTEEQTDDGGKVELEKPFEISKLPDNDVFLTIKEITLGEECRFGMYVPGSPLDDLGEDQQYLQILGEVDVQKLDNPQSQGMVFLNVPKAVDADKFAKEADFATDCQPGEGYEDWMTPTDAGDKSRRYGAFIVPKGVTEVRVEGKVYKVE